MFHSFLKKSFSPLHMFNILLQKIISAVDADKNGTIEFDEFIDFFMNLGPKIQT